MPRLVASLSCELARLAHVIAIALDFLLRLGEVSLRGLQAARRELADLGFVGPRNQCARLVENAALDRDQLRFAQQDFRFRGAALRILGVVLLVLRHRFAESLGGFLPCLRRELRCFRGKCVLARFDDRAEQLSRCRCGSRRAAQCRFAFLHSRAHLVGVATATGIFDRGIVGLHGRSEIRRRQGVDLFAARLVERSRKGGRIQVLRGLRSAREPPASQRSIHAKLSRSHLSRTSHHVLVTGQLLDPDRSACMKLVGRDPDLGAHAELAAVGELRGRVVQNDRAVDARRGTGRPSPGCG